MPPVAVPEGAIDGKLGACDGNCGPGVRVGATKGAEEMIGAANGSGATMIAWPRAKAVITHKDKRSIVPPASSIARL